MKQILRRASGKLYKNLRFVCLFPKGSKTKILRFNIVSPFQGYLHSHACFYKHVIPMGF